MPGERRQPDVPIGPDPLEPRRGIAERRRLKLVARLPSQPLGADETGAPQASRGASRLPASSPAARRRAPSDSRFRAPRLRSSTKRRLGSASAAKTRVYACVHDASAVISSAVLQSGAVSRTCTFVPPIASVSESSTTPSSSHRRTSSSSSRTVSTAPWRTSPSAHRNSGAAAIPPSGRGGTWCTREEAAATRPSRGEGRADTSFANHYSRRSGSVNASHRILAAVVGETRISGRYLLATSSRGTGGVALRQLPGGRCTRNVAMYDAMQHIRPDVKTICYGIGMSAAAMIVAGRRPRERLALPHANLMIHQGSAGFRGAPSDVSIAAREIESTTRQMAEILSRHTGRPVERVLDDIDRDRFMTAAEAVAYGLLDDVLEPRPDGNGRSSIAPMRRSASITSASPSTDLDRAPRDIRRCPRCGARASCRARRAGRRRRVRSRRGRIVSSCSRRPAMTRQWGSSSRSAAPGCTGRGGAAFCLEPSQQGELIVLRHGPRTMPCSTRT